jgi:STE24 endopeptidase
MNAFFIIILAAVLAEYALGIVSNVLNLSALKPQAPAGLEDLYDPEKYQKSQEYTKVNTGFDMITSTFTLAVLLTFWFLSGFNELDLVVRGWGFPVLVEGVLYIGILGLAYILITLPFSIYGTFVIEEQFGFNKTTWGTFIIDKVKGLGLGIALGVPLLAAILAFFEYAGDLAWLYAWVAVTIVTLAIQFIAPTWIMPLFNKFTPLESGELREAILDYARSVNFTLDNILVMDGSKRSSKANAFFTGFGKNKRIALFDTLMETQTVPELVSVLAHEIGHYKKKHIIQNMVVSIVHTAIIFFLLSIFLNNEGLFDAFFMDEMSVYAGLLFFGMLYTPVELVLSIVLQHISRKHEYEADRWSLETYERPEELSSALKKLSAENLSNLAPHPFYVLLNYTHPPLVERVRAIERK